MFLPEIFNYFSSASDNQISAAEIWTVPLVLILFLVGYIYIWINEKIAGIIFLSYHLIVWILSMMVWPEAGMVLVLILPVLFFGVFFIRSWYIANNVMYKQSNQQWKLTLRILIINYALVYLVVVFAKVIPTLFGVKWPANVDNFSSWTGGYLSPLGLILIFALVIFLAGLLVSWKRELHAGLLFVFWYLLILSATLLYPEFNNSGPWLIIGLTILVQGILYIRQYR